jgi:hypothetical protein
MLTKHGVFGGPIQKKKAKPKSVKVVKAEELPITFDVVTVVLEEATVEPLVVTVESLPEEEYLEPNPEEELIPEASEVVLEEEEEEKKPSNKKTKKEKKLLKLSSKNK